MQLAVSEHYGEISKETDILSSSPVELVILVYGRVIDSIASAKTAIENGGDSRPEIDRAFRLIQHGLLNVIDYNAGEVADSLSTLYRWTLRQILLASISRDSSRLTAVIDALNVVQSGWKELLAQSQVSPRIGKSMQQSDSFAAQYSHRA